MSSCVLPSAGSSSYLGKESRPVPSLGLEARPIRWKESREELGLTDCHWSPGSEWRGWGAGVRGLEQGYGRRPHASVSSEAQESLPWPGARGRPLLAPQGHLLSLAPTPSQPWRHGGAERRPFPWTPAGCRLGPAGRSWLASASLFSILYLRSSSQAPPCLCPQHTAKTRGSTLLPTTVCCAP